MKMMKDENGRMDEFWWMWKYGKVSTVTQYVVQQTHVVFKRISTSLSLQQDFPFIFISFFHQKQKGKNKFIQIFFQVHDFYYIFSACVCHCHVCIVCMHAPCVTFPSLCGFLESRHFPFLSFAISKNYEDDDPDPSVVLGEL